MNQLSKDLIIAACLGDTATVSRLLKAGANVDDVDAKGLSALGTAARRGFPAVVTVLLAAGADVQAVDPAGGNNALHLAIDGMPDGRASVQPELDDIGAYSASRPGDEHDRWMAVVRTLIKAGIEVSRANDRRQTPLMRAALKRDDDVSAELLGVIIATGRATINEADNAGLTALHYASRGGNVKSLLVLLSAGAAADLTDEYGFTALHDAAQLGHVEAAQALLAGGADPRIGLTRVFEQHPVGSTPHHLAERNAYRDLVELLSRAMR